MNIFEKYIANVQENERLDKIIAKLCWAHLLDAEGVSERMRGVRVVKLLKWEFEDKYNPNEITMTFIEEDIKTKEEREVSEKIKWTSLLLKVDNYE